MEGGQRAASEFRRREGRLNAGGAALGVTLAASPLGPGWGCHRGVGGNLPPPVLLKS